MSESHRWGGVRRWSTAKSLAVFVGAGALLGAGVLGALSLRAAGALIAMLLGVMWMTTRDRSKVLAHAGIVNVATLTLVPALALGTPYVVVCVSAFILADVVALQRTSSHLQFPRGFRLLALFFLALTLPTIAFGDLKGFAGLGLAAIAILPVYLVVGLGSHDERVMILRGTVMLALAEALLAAAEFFVPMKPLWSRVGYASETAVPSMNGIFSSHPEAQGTLGHHLPLSYLLIVGLALLLRRDLDFSVKTRWSGAVVLIMGCLVAGSRAGVIFGFCLIVLYAGGEYSWGRRALGISLAGVSLILAWLLGFFGSDAVGRLINSGSLYHRTDILSGLPGLMDQPLLRIIFGNGWGQTDRLFATGVLPDSNFRVVDNQMISILAAGGLLAACLITVLLVAAFRQAPGMRPTLFCALFMFMIYDLLAWPASAALFSGLLAISLAEGRPMGPAPSGSGATSLDGGPPDPAESEPVLSLSVPGE